MTQPVRVLPDAKYGEAKDLTAQQQGAPMSAAPAGPPPPAQTPVPRPAPGPGAPPAGPPEVSAPVGAPPDRSPLVGLGAPTQRPGEPVTAGARVGPGPGPQQPPGGVNIDGGQLSRALEPYFAEDDTGYLRLLAEDLAEWGI